VDESESKWIPFFPVVRCHRFQGLPHAAAAIRVTEQFYEFVAPVLLLAAKKSMTEKRVPAGIAANTQAKIPS
jgi:hypothetical protein